MEDTKIVELYLKRNERAIEETSVKYGSRLKKIAYNIVGSSADADECENDMYLSAWNLIPPHEPNSYLFVFLAKIIRNLSLNCCKRQRAQKRSSIFVELTTELQECIPGPSNTECIVTDKEFGEIISEFLRDISMEARNVFLRRYWYGDSINDISQDFGMSESKVKSMLFRTRNKMRSYLEKEGYNL